MTQAVEDDGVAREHWTLDRRVPIAIILALFIQTFGAVWWAASFSASMEERVKQLETTNDAKSNLGERMASVEAQLSFINGGMSRIEDKIDRVIDARNIPSPSTNYGKR